MSKIAIKSLKELAYKHKLDIVIAFAVDSDGETTHIATWGKDIEDCDRAAIWGNRMKEKLGWPQSLFATPYRVKKMQKRIADLETFIADCGYAKDTVEDAIKSKEKRMG